MTDQVALVTVRTRDAHIRRRSSSESYGSAVDASLVSVEKAAASLVNERRHTATRRNSMKVKISVILLLAALAAAVGYLMGTEDGRGRRDAVVARARRSPRPDDETIARDADGDHATASV